MKIWPKFKMLIFAQKLVPTCSDYSPDAGTTFIFLKKIFFGTVWGRLSGLCFGAM